MVALTRQESRNMNTASNDGRMGPLTKALAFVIPLSLALAVALFATLRSPTVPLASVSRVTIAVPMHISSATFFVAAAGGLFQKTGVEVITQPFSLGKDALQSVIDGRADLALVADTPLMFALQNGAEISVLAGLSRGRRLLAVVARKDRGIRRLEDLRGKSVGLSLGTNLPYFLDAMLQVHGVPSETVRLVDLTTPEVVNALLSGNIDAATLYQPFLATVLEQMGGQVEVFYGEDIYSFRNFLVGKTSYIDSHPQEIRRILQGLIAAQHSIEADPASARKVVAHAIGIKEDMLATLFDAENYMVTLDQAMLLTLDDQTRWAMKRGLVKTGPLPNYLNAIKYQHLEALLPSAVTIVR
jgi:ABC-type nitrate/sulfonate/bicarbonate transport system substrate-binding protein